MFTLNEAHIPFDQDQHHLPEVDSIIGFPQGCPWELAMLVLAPPTSAVDGVSTELHRLAPWKRKTPKANSKRKPTANRSSQSSRSLKCAMRSITCLCSHGVACCLCFSASAVDLASTAWIRGSFISQGSKYTLSTNLRPATSLDGTVAPQVLSSKSHVAM